MDCFDEHIVVYIDFLGFKNFNKKSKDERLKFISFLKQIKKLDSDVKVQEGVGKSVNFHVASSFSSDGLVLAWPLNQPGLPVDQSVITISILPYITQIMIRALCFGMLIRGAITVGEFYHQDGIFLGRSFDNATAIEKEVAIYPRVVISNDIFKRNLMLTPVEPNIAICRKAWLKDFDDIKYLNYLHCASFRRAFWPCDPSRDEKILDEKVKEWISNSVNIIKQNINLYNEDENLKILQKWQWFRNYFYSMITSLSENDKWTGVTLECLEMN